MPGFDGQAARLEALARFAWTMPEGQPPGIFEILAFAAKTLGGAGVFVLLNAAGDITVEAQSVEGFASRELVAAIAAHIDHHQQPSATCAASAVVYGDHILIAASIPGHAARVAFLTTDPDNGVLDYVECVALFLSHVINVHASNTFSHSTNRLTGLWSREAFVARAREALARRSVGAAIVLDLDGFKLINDLLGNAFGDRVLIEVARRTAIVAGPGALVAHGGADEFLVFLGDVTTRAEIGGFISRLSAELRQPIGEGDAITSVTISSGAALSPDDGTSIEEIVSHADLALHDVRRGERGAHRFYNPDIRQRSHDRHELVADIRGAIDRHELLVYYQPTVDLTTGAIAGAEALIRWQHPQRGLLPPRAFLNAAVEAGVLADIGRFVLRTVCETLSSNSWNHPKMPISVNVAAAQLYDPSLIAHAEATTRHYGISPHQLVLEILEDTLVADPLEMGRRLMHLRSIGFRIALDDFGTGLSSLSYLTTLPIDAVKIDQSFVARVGAIREDAVLESIRLLSDRLGLVTIAEGIETEAQRNALLERGYRIGQGYLYSAPMPTDDFVAWLRKHDQGHAYESFGLSA